MAQQAVPRRWDIRENEPDMVGKGYRILVDGVEIRRVLKFDVDAGIVEARNPSNPEYVHHYRGEVEVFPPAETP